MAKEKKEEKKKEFNINNLVKKLKKEYGTLKVAVDEVEIKGLISTGNKALDLALDGGVNMESVVELSGFSQSGKTTIMQLMLADMQKRFNATGIWLDRENAFFKNRSEFLGINTSKTMVLKPLDIPTVPDATDALENILSNIPKDEYKFIAIDSISSFDDTAKTKKSDMGKKAQHVHRLFRRILPYVDDKTLFVFVNQRTYLVGVLYGDNTTTTSGEAGKYYSNFRIELDNGRNLIDINRGNEIIGNWMNAKVIKTRFGPSLREIKFQHLFKKGIPYLSGYIRLLANRNIVQPKNKKEFNSFKQTTIKYKDKELQEYNVEQILKDYPELIFDIYPEYNVEEEKIEEENTSE